MPTYTITADTADGQITSTSATYSLARSGTGLAVDTTNTNPGHGQDEFFSYHCYEQGTPFDTSTIDDADTVTVVALSFYGQADNSGTDFISEVRMHPWGPTYTTADYVDGASLTGLTRVASYDTSAGWSLAGYNAYTSDATFPANISTAAVTYLMLSSSRHAAGTTPGTGSFETINAYGADDAGTTRDPQLVVTTVAGAAPVTPFIPHRMPLGV